MKNILLFIFLALASCQNQQTQTIINPPIKRLPHECSDCTGIVWGHIRSNYKYAQQANERFGIPASISMAQAILESGAGTSHLGQRNNFFGHRSFPRDEAHYYAGDTIRTESGAWRVYPDAETAYLEHGRFFLYTRVWNAKEGKFIYPYRHLCRKHWQVWCGDLNKYAGDSTYCTQLEYIISQYRLTEYDENL